MLWYGQWSSLWFLQCLLIIHLFVALFDAIWIRTKATMNVWSCISEANINSLTIPAGSILVLTTRKRESFLDRYRLCRPTHKGDDVMRESEKRTSCWSCHLNGLLSSWSKVECHWYCVRLSTLGNPTPCPWVYPVPVVYVCVCVSVRKRCASFSNRTNYENQQLVFMYFSESLLTDLSQA